MAMTALTGTIRIITATPANTDGPRFCAATDEKKNYYILLTLESIFLDIAEEEDDDDDDQTEDLSAQFVHRAIDSMVNEYDGQVATALLSAAKSRFQLGLTPSRATRLFKDIETQLEAWEASKLGSPEA